jgi:hypothetical protein
MTEAERAALKNQIDEVVTLETVQGDRLLVQILIVVDEGETPDLFCVEVNRNPDGSYSPRGTTGHSILLSDIVSVTPLPA